MKDWQQFTIALLIVFGFIGIQVSVVFLALAHPMPPELISMWDNIMMLVVGFYFGSSMGSKNKDTMIDNLTKTASVVPSEVPPKKEEVQ